MSYERPTVKDYLVNTASTRWHPALVVPPMNVYDGVLVCVCEFGLAYTSRRPRKPAPAVREMHGSKQGLHEGLRACTRGRNEERTEVKDSFIAIANVLFLSFVFVVFVLCCFCFCFFASSASWDHHSCPECLSNAAFLRCRVMGTIRTVVTLPNFSQSRVRSW